MACFRNLEKSQLKAGIRLHGLWLLCALHVSWIHHEHSISLAASTVGGLKPVGKTCPSTVDKDHVCIWYMNTKKRTVSKQVIHSVLPIGLHQPYFSAIRGSRIATLLRMMLQQSDGFSAAEVLEIKVISHPARIFFRCWFCFVTFCGVQGVGRMIETTRSLKENSRLFGDKGYSHPHFPPPTVYHSFWTTNYCRWNFSHWHLIWPDLQETFKKFDEDGSGDIDVCELSDMLRFQGHAAGIDEATTELGRKQGQWRNNLFQGKQK